MCEIELPRQLGIGSAHPHACYATYTLENASYQRGGGVGQDHVNTDFADSALLLPLNLYGEKEAVLLG